MLRHITANTTDAAALVPLRPSGKYTRKITPIVHMSYSGKLNADQKKAVEGDIIAFARHEDTQLNFTWYILRSAVQIGFCSVCDAIRLVEEGNRELRFGGVLFFNAAFTS
jgi:hypothetical protein